MANPRIKWHNKGFRQVRTSVRAQAAVLGMAQDIADASGDGFEARPTLNPRNRARAAVVTTTVAAMKDNNRMLRNIERGRRG